MIWVFVERPTWLCYALKKRWCLMVQAKMIRYYEELRDCQELLFNFKRWRALWRDAWRRAETPIKDMKTCSHGCNADSPMSSIVVLCDIACKGPCIIANPKVHWSPSFPSVLCRQQKQCPDTTLRPRKSQRLNLQRQDSFLTSKLPWQARELQNSTPIFRQRC